jgi:cell division protein FtsB
LRRRAKAAAGAAVTPVFQPAPNWKWAIPKPANFFAITAFVSGGTLVHCRKMNIWDKLTKAVLFLLLAAGLLAVFVWYLPLIRQNERLRKEMLRLDMAVQKEEELNKSLKASVEASHSDPKTIERLARTHLGYARTGEIVVRFQAPAATTNQWRR